MSAAVRWKSLPSSRGRYEISDTGQVRDTSTGRISPVRTRSRDGYLATDVYIDGKRKTKTIHALVCEAFNGPKPDGYHCAHLNGVKDDNRPENLRWVTPAENSSHRDLHGTLFHGETNPQSKLTKDGVLTIRERRAAGEAPQSIATDFGVARQTVEKIAQGKRWAHVGGPRTPPRQSGDE